uniref:TRAF3 binding protein n=1 Tax=Mus musculus TaxID=10090 RepID=Q8R4W8_MOUSE|nr:TRAF3 binding protein [Mus musculus]
MGARRLRFRSQRSRDSSVPTQCNQTECFDPLVRNCVSCELFHTPDTGHTSSLEPGTALQPQEGSALRPDVALLVGAPALLGLILALTLVGLVSLVSWRWRQQLRTASPDTSEGVQQESLENVFVPSSETPHASAPTWPPLKEDADSALPRHSVPVPATELGSTELVTTKTAGPEQ